jgi:predicted nucleic acid-binding protein
MIDTGVLIRALGERPGDPDSRDCVDFVEAMLAGGRELLVAAPSVAELMRGQAVPTPPSTPGLVIVAFDDLAAIELGTRFPVSSLKSLAATSGLPLTYLKYDAMIAACAIRHKAAFLITVDKRLSAQVPSSLKVARPGDFRAKQMQLVAVPSAPAAPKPKKGRKGTW